MRDNPIPEYWGCWQFTGQFGLKAVQEQKDNREAEFEEIDLSTKEGDKEFFTSGQVPIACNPPPQVQG
jgi:hypothetical protein